MKNFLILLPLAAYSLGCSTVGEALSPSDSTQGYRKVQVSGSSPKYVRKRIRSSSPITSPVYNDPPRPSSPSTSEQIVGGLASNLVEGSFKLIGALANSMAEETSTTKTYKSYSEPTSPGKVYLGLSFAASSQEGALHSGIELEGNLASWSSLRGGVSFISSDRAYWGFDGGLRFFFPWKFSPYIGLGGYAGDSKVCTYKTLSDYDTLETCEKFFLFTFYPEAGVQWVVNDSVKLTAYVRDYSRIDQKIRDRSYYLWGLGLVFR